MPARWNRPVFLLTFFEDKIKRITWTKHWPVLAVQVMRWQLDVRAGTYRLSLKRLDRTRALNATPNARSLPRIRYFGALSQGNASVIWRASHSAVGCGSP